MRSVSAVEGYALWAETFDATASPIVALEERALRPWIERLAPRRVVDIGCGTGRWTTRFRAIGLDLSPAMLAVAARKPELRGRLAAADATRLPIASESCDLAICALTLGHIRDPRGALRELSRILEPRGTLILTDFHPAAAELGWRRTFRHGDEVFELENHPYSVDELSAAPLVLCERLDACIGEPEREIFLRAGRPELFDAARRAPAVLLTLWMRT